MSTIGYKVVSPMLDRYPGDYPVMLEVEIPDNAIIVNTGRKFRTNLIIPRRVGYIRTNFRYLSFHDRLSWMRTTDSIIYVSETDPDDWFDFNRAKKEGITIPLQFISRYSLNICNKALLYTLGHSTELPIEEVDLDKSNDCSAGISYFSSYDDAIDFLNIMEIGG